MPEVIFDPMLNYPIYIGNGVWDQIQIQPIYNRFTIEDLEQALRQIFEDEPQDIKNNEQIINKDINNKIMLKNITIGADPELFIFNTATKTVVSSIGIIPGEKGKAWVDPAWPKGFGLEIDNILAEFNIPPCTTKEQFLDSMVFMKKYIRDFVKKVNPDYDIRCRASYMVPADQLQSKEAKKFGCSVDYNAYTEEPNPKPEGENTNLRSAGCHIHIGYDNPNVETSLLIVKYLDAYLGVPSVLLDGDTNRRSLYGKAGAFRLTDYGKLK